MRFHTSLARHDDYRGPKLSLPSYSSLTQYAETVHAEGGASIVA